MRPVSTLEASDAFVSSTKHKLLKTADTRIVSARNRSTQNARYCNIPKTQEEMNFEQWCRVIDKLAPYTEFFSLLGGEPTLHMGLPQIIQHLNSIEKDYTVVTNSTAPFDYYKYLIEGVGLNSLGISIDPTDLNSQCHHSERKSKGGMKLVNYIRHTLRSEVNIVISSILGTDPHYLRGL